MGDKYVLSRVVATKRGGVVTFPLGVYPSESVCKKAGDVKAAEIAMLTSAILVVPDGRGGGEPVMTLGEFLQRYLEMAALSHTVNPVPEHQSAQELVLTGPQKLII